MTTSRLFTLTSASSGEHKSEHPKEGTLFSKNDLIRKKGVNTYGLLSDFSIHDYGLTLSLKQKMRTEFYQRHPLIKQLSKEEKQNPILEEGKITSRPREQEGEYFLTKEIMELIIHHKILQHKTKIGGISYNKKNIFLLDNLEDLTNTLQNLSLKSGEDAKFIYLKDIHGTAFYVRNADGKISCFIVDSTKELKTYCIPIVKTIHQYIPKAFIVLSTTALQNDWYSCTTFSIAILRYFVKHGKEVFPYLCTKPLIKRYEFTDDKPVSYFLLDAPDLMPHLIKFTQSHFEVSEDSLNTIVSHKRSLTLEKYLENSLVNNILDEEENTHSKSYYVAIFNKRYKWFAEIDTYLTKLFKSAAIANDLTQVKFLIDNHLVLDKTLEDCFLQIPLAEKPMHELLWKTCQDKLNTSQKFSLAAQHPEIKEQLNSHLELKKIKSELALKLNKHNLLLKHSLFNKERAMSLILDKLPNFAYGTNEAGQLVVNQKEIADIKRQLKWLDQSHSTTNTNVKQESKLPKIESKPEVRQVRKGFR